MPITLALLCGAVAPGALLAPTARCAAVDGPFECVAAHYPLSSPPRSWRVAGAGSFMPAAGNRDGCGSTWPDVATGVALVARGGCAFGDKVLRAQAAGASAVVIVDHDRSDTAADNAAAGGEGADLVAPGLGDGHDTPIAIPVVLVAAATGHRLAERVGAGAEAALDIAFETTGGGGAVGGGGGDEGGDVAAARAQQLAEQRSRLHARCISLALSSYECAAQHRALQQDLASTAAELETEAEEERHAQERGQRGAPACSPEQHAAQRAYFARATGGGGGGGGSDGEEFNGEDEKLDTLLLLLHRLSPEPAGKVVLDVGCARGDFSFRVQALWNLHTLRVYDGIMGQPSPPHVFPPPASLARVHCFEPVPETFAVLRHARERHAAMFSALGTTTALHNVALTDAAGAAASGNGTVQMFTTTDVVDSVVSSIAQAADPALTRPVLVNVTTVDAFVAATNEAAEAAAAPDAIDRIEILKVDTEGADALVLSGARGLLAAGRVNLLAWEYGHVWTVAVDTGRHNLQSTVQALDAMGYDSFLLGRQRMLQLNGNCWSGEYEFWWWSNIVSMSRSWRHRESLVRLYADFPWPGSTY